tara:strand:+ start:99 stop:344 length:246 start_codon:yes stop_codon:yes gene_type:complete
LTDLKVLEMYEHVYIYGGMGHGYLPTRLKLLNLQKLLPFIHVKPPMRMLLIFKSFKSCAMQQNSARILKACGSLKMFHVKP